MSDKVKLSRKDLKKPDEFLLFTGRAYNWVQENQRAVIYGIIIIFVIVIGIVLTVNYNHKVEQSAANIVFELEQNYDAMKDKTGQERQELRQKVDESIENILEDYPSSDSAAIAYIYRANMLYEEGKYEDAVKNYEFARDDLSSNRKASALILMNLGYSYEAMNDNKNACDYFQKAAKIENAPARDITFYKAGSCLAGLGRMEEAKSYYRMLISDYPDSKFKDRLRAIVN